MQIYKVHIKTKEETDGTIDMEDRMSVAEIYQSFDDGESWSLIDIGVGYLKDVREIIASNIN